MENSGLASGGMNVGNEQWLGFPQPRYSILYLWMSSLFRIIRKRLVLGIIFTFSLFYCIANLYLGSHSVMRKDSDNSDDVKIIPSWQREGGLVNFPWRSADDDVVKQPEPPLDPSGNDTNRHLQEADEKGRNMDAGPMKFPPRSKPITCRNSIQGKALIADDRGYVCKRHEVLPSGCCDTEIETTSRYACDTCLTNHCCEAYEHCISCCLDPEKKSILQAILAKASEHQNLLFASVTDHFELCLAKCRTSSESVQHQNLYRNPQAKHCYGTQLPDIQHSP